MKVGDIYRFKPEFLATHKEWVKGPRFPGHGPFKIVAIRNMVCDVQSLEDGQIHTSWAGPEFPHWGNLDKFLTAAYEATHGQS